MIMSIETLTTFLGWCSVINISILLFSTILLLMMKNTVAKIHGRLFNINQKNLIPMYFQYLGNYKIAILILNIAPYFALKIMA